MRQELTFNGKALSEFGLWYDGSVSFGSPERDVELVEVVGRNGALSISNDRFRNIEITFPCAIRTNFITNYRSLMAFLNSSKGYCRLETTQEPNYYRLALFMNQTDPTGYKLNTHGRFDLVFQVMPQRFLKSGETTTSVSSSSSDVTGNPVSIDNPSGLTALTGLSVDIQPVQDLNGYDHPWIGGAGENLLNPTNLHLLGSYSLTTTKDDLTGVWTISGTYSGSASSVSYRLIDDNDFPYDSNAKYYAFDRNAAGQSHLSTNGIRAVNNTTGGMVVDLRDLVNGSTYNIQFKPMIYHDDRPAKWSPYENICPITGHTSASVTRTVDGSATDYTINLNGTVYGGELDVLTGVLTVDRLMADGGDLTWTKVTGNNYRNFTAAVANLAYDVNVPKVLSSAYKSVSNNTAESGDDAYVWSWNGAGAARIAVKDTTKANMTVAEFKTAMTGVQFCYELATPTTVQLTPKQVSLLTGTNIISTDMNSLTVTIASPAELENPTLFESKPLIRVYGNGTLNVNDIYITVANSPYEYIDIDCELMDCYHGSNNANQYVSFSTTDYVTLRSGTNYFSYSGFTQVEVTPRWFEV